MNTRANIGRETVRQGRVFALGDMQNTEAVVLGIIPICAKNAGSMMCAYVYLAYDVVSGDMTLYVDLLPLDIDHFNYILGVDWLMKIIPSSYLISARNLLRKGCRGYLCCILNVTSDSPNVETIPVVNEFSDIFPNELLEDLIDREIEFTITVVLGTQPISKTPY
ncbi:uncharacterized protein LOC114290729 [Camellia sinensis]|uniref:uncharacterized protein LOC114290729 n=1 Tax=Camellia sinensis TaxID=4442 RepID=UPI001035F001|nr:uncharacterized protein LOC114290729 [Camellia sinensis]